MLFVRWFTAVLRTRRAALSFAIAFAAVAFITTPRAIAIAA
ncbi:hypothetical protein Q7O_004191 [Pectobacterium carotovorum subsp. carotovorum PCCS1]|nr:hypothetical protein [Pectobacterium carotovorum subsp. carotovorum PCCS1]